MKKLFLLLLAFLISIFLFSCAEDHVQPNVTVAQFKENIAQEKSEKEEKQMIWDFAIPVTEDSDYRLQTGDLVSISVFEIPELNISVRINSRGNVSVPLLNQISLEGLTAAEAEEAIEELLKQDYMHDPHVTLIVQEMVGQQVTMVGALNQPGTYEIKSKRTILDMLALSGGRSENASDVAYLTRKMDDTYETKVFLINLYQLITKGQVDMNVPVKGGDVIFIPVAGVVSVDGAVRQPGTVYLEGEMTINEAIASAGGLAKYADLEDIKLIRVLDTGQRQVVQLSMAEIQSNSDKEFLLREDDIVYVEASNSKVFSTGFGFDLGFMGTGVSFDSPLK